MSAPASRRHLLGAAAGAFLHAPLAAAPGADAGLLAMLEQLKAIEAESDAIGSEWEEHVSMPAAVQQRERELTQAGWALRNAMADAVAITPAGMRAKAAAALIYVCPQDMEPGEDWHLAASLCRDLLTLSGGAA